MSIRYEERLTGTLPLLIKSKHFNVKSYQQKIDCMAKAMHMERLCLSSYRQPVMGDDMVNAPNLYATLSCAYSMVIRGNGVRLVKCVYSYFVGCVNDIRWLQSHISILVSVDNGIIAISTRF